MAGIHEFKFANPAIVPDIALPSPSLESLYMAILIHMVAHPDLLRGSLKKLNLCFVKVD